MDPYIQRIEFLDLSDASEEEVQEISNILFSETSIDKVSLPWQLPSDIHWSEEHSIHQAYAAVPLVGVQPHPHPLGHSGPPWVALPPNPADDGTVNGGSEDGLPILQPVATSSLQIYPPIIHHQPSMIVSSVTANVNVHSFHHPGSYPIYQNPVESAVVDSPCNNARKPRLNKVTKRPDNIIRKGIEPGQPPFTSQHQFSPNAPPYIPAQPYSYYPPQGPPGHIPSPQAMAGSPLYINTPQIPFGPVLHPAAVIGTYSPGAVYTTAPHIIEQPDLKDTVPFHSDPIQTQDTTPLVGIPISSGHDLQDVNTMVISRSDEVQLPNEVPLKDEEEENYVSVVSTVIENSSIITVPNPMVSVESPGKNISAHVKENGLPQEDMKQTNSIEVNLEEPINDQKQSVNEEESQEQIVTTVMSNQRTYASLFSNSDSKSTATIKSTVLESNNKTNVNNYASKANVAAAKSSVRSNYRSPLAINKTMPPVKSVANKSLPAPVISDDPRLLELGNFLVNYKLEHKPSALQPRGLTNRSNYCYINAILQALLACPPLYNLLKRISPYRMNSSNPKGKSFTPIIDSMIKFMKEFDYMSTSNNLLKTRRERTQAKKDEQGPVGGIEIVTGAAFEPTYVYKMLNVIRNDTAFQIEGRQEDAEEFLSCLLNGLNDEMLELQKLVNNTISNGDVRTNGEVFQDLDNGDAWKEVTNARNKQTITRRTEITQTPLSQIFQGQLRSSVHRAGTESTDNIQPFFTLPLDIENVQSVKEALEKMVGKDILEGVTCTKTNREVEAFQQVTLEQLPLVLLLHLKCFDYKLQTCAKITKAVEFPIDLKIEPKLMSSVVKNKNKKTNGNSNKDRQYKLFAVVYHDGKEATKGHYITDVYHVGYGMWVRYDDATVKPVTEQQVLHPKSPRVPYLLYYRRLDTININNNQNNRSQKSEL